MLLPKYAGKHKPSTCNPLKYALAVAGLVIFWASQQAMADNRKQAISFGATSCADVTQALPSGNFVLDHATTWTEGYLSAQNFNGPEWIELVESTLSRGQRENFIYAYCKKYPKALVLDASQEIQRFLESELIGRAKKL